MTLVIVVIIMVSLISYILSKIYDSSNLWLLSIFSGYFLSLFGLRKIDDYFFGPTTFMDRLYDTFIIIALYILFVFVSSFFTKS